MKSLILSIGVLMLASCGDSDSDSEMPADPTTFTWLSQTGLYSNIASQTIADDMLSFEPTYRLWTDAADKRRWISLPAGTQIDTSDADAWQFPVGTRIFKEFSRNGLRLETRMIQRTGPGDSDWYFMAFVWNADQSDAVATPEGQENALGTTHVVPSQTNCMTCHNGESGRLLGFSPLQLAQSSGQTTLQSLIDDGLVSNPETVVGITGFPGEGVEKDVMGYLHTNCGSCHNPQGSAWPDTGVILRIAVGEIEANQTELFNSTVDIDLDAYQYAGYSKRIVSGDPDSSALLYRMSVRDMPDTGTHDQMPPLGTEEADASGVGLVQTWIESL